MLFGKIESLLAILGHGTREQNLGALAELRHLLDTADRPAAIAAIKDFLLSGRDSATGLDFAVGPGGILNESPSLRVFLLDELGDLSPAAALPISQQILQTKTSADEWAISLRNVAWADPASRPYLDQKVTEMLTYQPWMQNPSGGFLESFDVAVYAQAVNLAPVLDSYLADQTSALWQASAVTLDRLAQYAPEQLLSTLNDQPTLLSTNPGLRSDYFAKAQLSDPAQLAAVETYLARSDVTVAEKNRFIGQLSQPGAFVSDNLIMPTNNPPVPNTPAVINTTAQQWLNSGKYPDLTGSLTELLNTTASQ